MATTNMTVNAGSYQLVTSETNFLIQVTGTEHVYFAFGTAAPAATVIGHVINRNEGLTRNGLTGNLYARAVSEPTAIVVSEG